MINTIRGKLPVNATTMKIIAVVLMVFDHVHQMFLPLGAPVWLTWLGRPVFPIFMLIMSESFHYTSNRKKLLTRLLLGSLLMSVFNVALNAYILPNENVVLMNNAFGTFFIAVLYMLFWDIFTEGIKAKKAGKIIGAVLLCFVPVLTAVPMIMLTRLETPPVWLVRTALLIPNVIVVEGGFAMVAMGVLFYIFRKWRWAQIAILAAVSALVFFTDPSGFQWMMVFAAIPMFLYNGEKGRGMKNFFYIFYPAHIYLLYILATLVMAGR